MNIGLKTLVIWFVVLGFLFSLHNRVAPESNILGTAAESTITNLCDKHGSIPHDESVPRGSHQDEHGCFPTMTLLASSTLSWGTRVLTPVG